MIKILVSRQSRYPANTREIKKRILKVLSDEGVKEGVVSLSFVGKRKIVELAKTHLGEENTVHEILTFPYADPSAAADDFIIESDVLQLGDIVICYPEARKIAQKRNRMVDDVLGELAEHGTLHLLGHHHGEVPEKLTH